MTEHTPWTIKWQHEGGVTVGTEEHPLIEISNIGIGHDAAMELAEQVIREHNAHDALKTACKKAQAALISHGHLDHIWTPSLEAIEAALNLAKEEQS